MPLFILLAVDTLLLLSMSPAGGRGAVEGTDPHEQGAAAQARPHQREVQGKKSFARSAGCIPEEV